MTIEITQGLNEARLVGTKAFLDQGINPATIKVYGGQRPLSVLDPPNQSCIVTLTLQRPCGYVSGGLLHIVQPVSDMVMVDGEVKWARWFNGNGDTAFDCDCGEGEGYWELSFDKGILYAGGYALVESAVLG